MRQPSFDDWVQRVFTGLEPSFEELWDTEAACSINWQLAYATRLFQAPTFLLDEFTEAQVREGLWRLPSAWELCDLLWNPRQAWEPREACIRAMYTLYRDLFALAPSLEDVAFMWWDLLRYFGDSPDPRTAATMLTAMQQVLQLGNHDCQRGALHGLGHLELDGKIAIIDAFLGIRACRRCSGSTRSRLARARSCSMRPNPRVQPTGRTGADLRSGNPSGGSRCGALVCVGASLRACS